ncbi:two-component system, sensor histidine kinase [Thermoflexales bacterium]|nr:two-component system, sensor histidine kinase [Thermoflexales bacterium]
MNLQFAPLSLLPLFTSLVGIVIATYAWRLRPKRGATALTLLSVAATVWTLGYALEIAGADLLTKLFCAKVEYLGIATVPLCWLIFSLEYAGRDRWLTRRNLALISIIPLVTILLAFTTEAHGLIWSTFSLDGGNSSAPLLVSHGAWFWVYWIYGQLIVLAGTIIVIRTLLGAQQLYRSQASLILIAALLPWVGNFLYVSGLNPIPPLDLTPFAFVLSAVAVTLGLSRFRLISLTPIAQATVIESMNDGMFVIDAHDNLADLNPAAERLLGISAAQVIGQPVAAVFQAWPDLVGRYQHIDEIRDEIKLGNGTGRRYYELRLSSLKNRRGELTGRVLLVRDITELIDARDRALEADRLKSELLARVSHELRTPLSAILGYAELLHDGSFGPLAEHQQVAVMEMMGSTQELTILVNELLDSAQLEAHALALRIRPFDPIEMLQRVENTLAVLAHNKGLELTTTASPDLPATLAGDESRLRQILINLIGNAIKFTESGFVRVHLYCVDEERWAMEVSDTGPGIPAGAQRLIFEPFRQVDGSVTREFRGTGLGLSIVKSLVALMGGSVKLESEVGQGSTFTITLPLQPRVESS